MSTIFPNMLDNVIGLYEPNNDLFKFVDLSRGSIVPESLLLGTCPCTMTAFIKTQINLTNLKVAFMNAEELSSVSAFFLSCHKSLFGRKMLPIRIVTFEIKNTPHFRDIMFACKTCTKDIFVNVLKIISNSCRVPVVVDYIVSNRVSRKYIRSFYITPNFFALGLLLECKYDSASFELRMSRWDFNTSYAVV